MAAWYLKALIPKFLWKSTNANDIDENHEQPSPDLWVFRIAALIFLVNTGLQFVSTTIFRDEPILERALFVSMQVLLSAVLLPTVIIRRNNNMLHFAKHVQF